MLGCAKRRSNATTEVRLTNGETEHIHEFIFILQVSPQLPMQRHHLRIESTSIEWSLLPCLTIQHVPTFECIAGGILGVRFVQGH